MIHVVQLEDWVGFYKDGKLLYEGHSIDWWRALTLLNIDFTMEDIDDYWDSHLPNTLEELEREKNDNKRGS